MLKSMPDMLGNTPKSSGDNLSSFNRVLATLWEMPEEYWKLVRHFGKHPNKNEDMMSSFPTGSPVNRKQGDPLGLWPNVSPYQAFSVYLFSIGEVQLKLV